MSKSRNGTRSKEQEMAQAISEFCSWVSMGAATLSDKLSAIASGTRIVRGNDGVALGTTKHGNELRQ